MSHKGIEALMEREGIEDWEEGVRLYLLFNLKRIHFYMKQKYGYYRGYPVMIPLFMNKHP